MKTITKIFVAAVALFGVAIAANAKSPKNTDNNVSSVAEHDIEVSITTTKSSIRRTSFVSRGSINGIFP